MLPTEIVLLLVINTDFESAPSYVFTDFDGGVENFIGGEGNEVCTPHHAYLHDGRARSIEEAILWHGGESEVSKVAYEALNASDKAAVLVFLNSL